MEGFSSDDFFLRIEVVARGSTGGVGLRSLSFEGRLVGSSSIPFVMVFLRVI